MGQVKQTEAHMSVDLYGNKNGGNDRWQMIVLKGMPPNELPGCFGRGTKEGTEELINSHSPSLLPCHVLPY